MALSYICAASGHSALSITRVQGLWLALRHDIKSYIELAFSDVNSQGV